MKTVNKILTCVLTLLLSSCYTDDEPVGYDTIEPPNCEICNHPVEQEK